MYSNMRTILLSSILLITSVLADYDSTCSNNVVTYWGQNSWGGGHLNEPDNWEKPLASYCQDSTFDIINISFLTNFNLTGLPVLNHAFHCETVFNGTNTLHCPDIGKDIKTCQASGKKIVLSLGGGNIYTYGLSSDADGKSFADTVWNMFLGGSAEYRPYDDAVLDGVDLDIESGEHTGYPAFINQLRSHFQGASKQYIISTAPQCVYPDANLGSTLSSGAWIDNDYVQFYNNPCNLANIDSKWNFDYASWDKLTSANSNPNSKMYVGLPAGTGAAGNGYLDLSTLQTDLTKLYTSYPSTFGGIMLWDASWYTNNQEYVQKLSSWVKSNMKCGSTPSSTDTSSSSITSTIASTSSATSSTTETSTSSAPATASSPPAYTTVTSL
ncbi:Chitinase 2 [Coemansia sp. RSA 1813]|nr:Chitinase 2 [Coemansia sp. RSA 1843]KAJ2092591.1 Chitinase 2 [Coemansia sp. RSA 986]KAJ2216714.1 Chitinase 2 [Coemansia sp. RSA 487]KAJ2572788.1 Chitinase 2 [Coemansia sp. RSA 1813]